MSHRTPKLVLALVAIAALAVPAGASAGSGPPKGPAKCAVGAVGGEGRTAPPWALLAIAAGFVALRRARRAHPAPK
jgi:hypothetical protein